MAWKNLKAEIEEEMAGFTRALEVTPVGLRKYAGKKAHEEEVKDRDAAIPETKAERTDRRRKERAARVEGLARGQHPNAVYQRRHMEKAYASGLGRPKSKHANPNLVGAGPRRRFEPTPAQRDLIADRGIRAEDLAKVLGVSRVMAFRLRKELLTGRRR